MFSLPGKTHIKTLSISFFRVHEQVYYSTFIQIKDERLNYGIKTKFDVFVRMATFPFRSVNIYPYTDVSCEFVLNVLLMILILVEKIALSVYLSSLSYLLFLLLNYHLERRKQIMESTIRFMRNDVTTHELQRRFGKLGARAPFCLEKTVDVLGNH